MGNLRPVIPRSLAEPHRCCHRAKPALGLVCLLLAAPVYAASPLMVLPALGNSAATDRMLSREVSDEHIFDPNTAEELPEEHIRLLERVQEQPPLDTPARLSSESRLGAAPDSVWSLLQEHQDFPVELGERALAAQAEMLENKLFLQKTLTRGTPFLAWLLDALDHHYMPLELALLPAIESGYQPNVESLYRAAGIWQIMPGTAREIGLRRDNWFDGRYDTVKATRAALDYLSYLHAAFNGNWSHALAAYNAGPGRVRTAIRKNQAAGKPLNIEALELPEETTQYVPKFMALVDLVRRADEFGVELPLVPLQKAFVEVDVGQRISLDTAAAMSGVDPHILQNLNTALLQGVTPPDGPHRLLLPVMAESAFKAALADAGERTLYTLPRYHAVAAGDTLSGIALRYGVSVSHLQRLNGLNNSRIRIGQQLAVSIPQGERIIHYVVKEGDTLSSIASQHKVGLKAIANSQGEPLADSLIHPGERLRVHLRGSSG